MSVRSYPGLRRLRRLDRALFNVAFVAQHYLPRSRVVAGVREGAHDRLVAQARAGGPGRAIPVERVRDISAERFRSDYVSKGIPVVIEGGAADWPLMDRWSIEQFRERFGDETILLVQRDGLTDDDVVFDREYSEELNFGEFLDGVLDGSRTYMRFSPLLEKFPELLADFDHSFFRRMVNSRWGHAFQLFIGGTSTVTPFHNAITPFIFTNVSGTKHWTLIPNHYLAILDPRADGYQYNHSGATLDLSNADEYPGIDCIDHLETTLEPGDLLFVPSWMWHGVRNESPTIGVRCAFAYLPGIVRESLTLPFVRVFAGRNPTVFEWLYYSYKKTDLPSRTKYLITPKWYRPNEVSDAA